MAFFLFFFSLFVTFCIVYKFFGSSFYSCRGKGAWVFFHFSLNFYFLVIFLLLFYPLKGRRGTSFLLKNC